MVVRDYSMQELENILQHRLSSGDKFPLSTIALENNLQKKAQEIKISEITSEIDNLTLEIDIG